MVQGRLLTTHPGGVHGGGEAPGGDPPLRQGAGKSSPGAPILEARRRRNRDEIAKKGSVLEGFGTRGKYMPKGGASRGPGGPGGLPARPGGWPRHQGAWGPGGPPPVALRLRGTFRNADFLYIFSGIFLTVFVMEKPEIQKQQKNRNWHWGALS